MLAGTVIAITLIACVAARAAFVPFMPCGRCHGKPKRRTCRKCHGSGNVLRPTRKAWAYLQKRAGHLQ